jgi:hypothetical protein
MLKDSVSDELVNLKSQRKLVLQQNFRLAFWTTMLSFYLFQRFSLLSSGEWQNNTTKLGTAASFPFVAVHCEYTLVLFHLKLLL